MRVMFDFALFPYIYI